jgi:hypothetical protein
MTPLWRNNRATSGNVGGPSGTGVRAAFKIGPRTAEHARLICADDAAIDEQSPILFIFQENDRGFS